ncbi:MAG: hypothetical protein AB4058_00855 [Microcystaceae cyanobacterium]
MGFAHQATLKGIQKPEIFAQYYGWYIAIEPESGDYFIDQNKELASQKAREKHPDRIHHLFGINETGVRQNMIQGKFGENGEIYFDIDLVDVNDLSFSVCINR